MAKRTISKGSRLKLRDKYDREFFVLITGLLVASPVGFFYKILKPCHQSASNLCCRYFAHCIFGGFWFIDFALSQVSFLFKK